MRENVWLNVHANQGADSPTFMIRDNPDKDRFVWINAMTSVTIGESALIADRLQINDLDHSFTDMKISINIV
jgi:hypothetical protein